MNSLDRSSGKEDLYYGVDLGASLSANRIIDLGKFEPSLRFGVGLSGGLTGFSPLTDDFFNVYGGLGLNYWFNDAVALTVKSTLKSYIKEFDDVVGNGDGGLGHLQHLAGLSFAFGGSNDTDGDGVKDSDDNCPEIPGLESLNGCPDDDGDGIINSEDRCPMSAGLAAFNGCPDSDGDGIIDIDDACPNAAGSNTFRGCPDTDGDGISDAEDACPRKAGPSSNKGCPEAPKRPKASTPATSKPYVAPPKYPLSMLNNYVINFDLDRDNVHAQTNLKSRIYTVAKVLLANPQADVSIQGHTDSTGSEAYNRTLSQRRADFVKNHLSNAGVSANRLSTKAFGESSPKASNATKQGRAENRRVEIKVVR